MANLRITGSPLTITIQKVIKAGKCLKIWKVPGPGNILVQLIKTEKKKLYEPLRKIFQDCMYKQSRYSTRKERGIFINHTQKR